MSEPLLDAAGRRRSPATMPGYHAGRPPRNKGMRYPADPPTVEQIVAAMRAGGDRVHGRRLRGLIVVLWRAGLRITEALALGEADLDPRRGSVLVRHGKGGRRCEVGMDDWAWEQLQPWLAARLELPSAPCSASSPARRAAAAGRPPPPAPNYATPHRRPACGAASRRTSSVTPTPSSSHTKACR
jgi:integrase